MTIKLTTEALLTVCPARHTFFTLRTVFGNINQMLCEDFYAVLNVCKRLRLLNKLVKNVCVLARWRVRSDFTTPKGKFLRSLVACAAERLR